MYYSYSQNKEDIAVSKFFDDYIGTLLSIGENDGHQLSNVLTFIYRGGWEGTLVEPAPKAFIKLRERHAENENIHCMNVAVGCQSGEIDFYDSGTHLNDGDISLLSTANEKDYDKWKGTTDFTKIKVPMVTFDEMLAASRYKTFDYISLDAEGFDLHILRQMDLTKLGCKVLCIEHNGNRNDLAEIRRLCEAHSLTNELVINGENIILTV